MQNYRLEMYSDNPTHGVISQEVLTEDQLKQKIKNLALPGNDIALDADMIIDSKVLQTEHYMPANKTVSAGNAADRKKMMNEKNYCMFIITKLKYQGQ